MKKKLLNNECVCISVGGCGCVNVCDALRLYCRNNNERKTGEKKTNNN